MKYRRLLFLFLLLNSTAYAVNNTWVGEWKINDKNKYMSFNIEKNNKTRLKFSYDEGVGINGIRIYGNIKFENKNTAFVDASVRGKPCRLKLHFLKQSAFALSNCTLDSYDESESEKIFVPRSQKLYFKASFNCAKAGTKIEVAICESKIIARADKDLGRIYSTLRKKLSKGDVRRLRKGQRHWVKKRDLMCKKKDGGLLDYCLRQYYGQRLLALSFLNNYKIWFNGNLNYSVLKKIKTKSYFNAMDNGLGLWLGGKINRQLMDTGSFEVKAKFVKNSYILSGRYSSNPAEGHDPRAIGNKIIIEFSKDNTLWLGLVDRGEHAFYIPKNKTVLDVSEEMTTWMGNVSTPEVNNIF